VNNKKAGAGVKALVGAAILAAAVVVFLVFSGGFFDKFKLFTPDFKKVSCEGDDLGKSLKDFDADMQKYGSKTLKDGSNNIRYSSESTLKVFYTYRACSDAGAFNADPDRAKPGSGLSTVESNIMNTAKAAFLVLAKKACDDRNKAMQANEKDDAEEAYEHYADLVGEYYEAFGEQAPAPANC
jgi:hypothetical protein